MKRGTHPYLGLAFLTGLNLFNYLDRQVLASVVPPIEKELFLNDAQIGYLTSAFMIGYFATSPIFGYLGDRSPRKWLIASGVFFWSLGTVLSGFCHGFWTFIACRVLVGLGEASYATLAPSWLSDLFPSERRNNALTIFYVAIPVGSALGYVLGGFSIHHGGWRNGFLWAGAPGLLLALALLLLTEPARGAADAGAADASGGHPAVPGWKDVVQLFKIRDFNLLLGGYTAYTFAMGAFAAWGPTFLNRVHDLELSKAGLFFGEVLVVAGLFGTLAGGFAATAWQRRNRAGYARLLTLSVVATVPFATVAFLHVSTFTSMACLGTAMLLLFLPTGPINTLIVESVPVALRASAMAASIFAIHLFGDFWSPIIVGQLSVWWQQPTLPAAGLQHAVLTLPAVLALAALFWGVLARRKAREPRGAMVAMPG